MKSSLFIAILFALSLNIAFGQDNNGAFSLGINLLPEMSIVDRDLLQNQSDLGLKISNGIGIELKRFFGKKYYVSSGVNIAQRKFGAIGSLNQYALPAPIGSPTEEAVSILKLTYWTLEVPLKAGMVFLETEKQTYYVYVGGSANFVLSGKYENSSSQYNGTYKRKGLKGFSGLVGLQSNYKLSDKLSFIYGAEFSVYNKIGKDNYISNNGDSEVALKHHFVRLSLGVSIKI